MTGILNKKEVINIYRYRNSVLIILVVTVHALCYAQTDNIKSGEIIVQLQKGKKINDLISTEIFKGHSINKIKSAEQLSSALNIWNLRFDTALFDSDEILTAVKNTPSVKIAQFNHYIEYRGVIPDDPKFGDQWNLNNDGSSGGVLGADISALDAWDLATGGVTNSGDTIVVAVIDEGFAILNSDLNYWKNRNEIPANGIDDDNNSYIDDYNGWDVFDNDDIHPVSDHGTHIAGIIGAKGNNGNGIAGINWNVRIMPVTGSSTLESDVIAAYMYVYEARLKYNKTNGAEGAFIVATNSSFGVNFGKPADFPIWCSLYDSFGVIGILSSVSGPNISVNVDSVGDIPATCPSDYVIGVTSTNNKDSLAFNVGFGITNIDIGAPGVNILSTVSADTINVMTGTSMAAPHVSGAIALMFSAASTDLMNEYNTNYGATALKIKNMILSSVDSVGDLDGKVGSAGRLNLYKCLLNAKNYTSLSNNTQSNNNKITIGNIYPNPAKHFIEVEIYAEQYVSISILVNNILGREVKKTKPKDFFPGNQILMVNIKDLETGFYLLTLFNQDIIFKPIPFVIY